MDEPIVRALGLSVDTCDLVVLITKDGLSDEDLTALEPMMEGISDTLSCFIVAFPERVFSDMRTLNLAQLLSMRDSIDEAISSKMNTTNLPIA